MEKVTKTKRDGTPVVFTMTREKGFFTSHIWVYRDGRPYLHIMPTATGTSQIYKSVGGRGYMSAGELMQDFNTITINNVIGL